MDACVVDEDGCGAPPPPEAAAVAAALRVPRPGGGVPLAEIGGDGAITVPMEIVAQGLRVPVETVLDNLRAGLVYQVTETGIGEDAGRFRITFRYRSRQYRVVVDQGGRILPAD